jgi:hypothetical protein
MQPIRAIKNQYPGINAHLHSFWQGEGEWNNFHNRHIGDLAGSTAPNGLYRRDGAIVASSTPG